MAKNAQKTNAFGITPDSFMTNKPAESNATPQNKETSKKIEIQGKEKKTKNIHILTKASLVERMDAFAKEKGLSRAEFFEIAMTHFLDNVDN